MVVLLVVLVGVLGVGELTVGQGHLVTVQLGETLSPPDCWLLLVHLRSTGRGGQSRRRYGGQWGLRLLQTVEALGSGGQGGLAVQRVGGLGGLTGISGGGQTEIR